MKAISCSAFVNFVVAYSTMKDILEATENTT
jgi:hypothetical protein